MSTHRFVKEVSKLAQRAEKVFGGVIEFDLEGLEDEYFHFYLSPKTGLYADAEFLFKYEHRGYDTAPYITTVYYVEHPNFFEDDAEICFNMLDEEFSSDFTVESFLVGMLFLIDNPNFEDPASETFSYSDFRQNERDIGDLIHSQKVQFEDQVMNYSMSIVQNSLKTIYAEKLDDLEDDEEDDEALKEKEDNASLDTADTDDLSEWALLCPMLKNISSEHFPSRKLAKLMTKLSNEEAEKAKRVDSKSLILNSFSPFYTMFTQFVSASTD